MPENKKKNVINQMPTSKEKNSCIFMSSVKRLRNLLIKSDYDYEFDLSKIEYIDPISGHGGTGNSKSLFSRKYNFDHRDDEIRAIIQLNGHFEPPKFLRIKVILSELVEKVIWNQNADKQFIKTIEELCESQNIICHKSRISE